MYKIKIENESGRVISEFEAESIDHSEDRGFNLEWDDNKKEYKVASLNGQHRVLIKGWRGCESFDSFVLETKIEKTKNPNQYTVISKKGKICAVTRFCTDHVDTACGKNWVGSSKRSFCFKQDWSDVTCLKCKKELENGKYKETDTKERTLFWES